MPKKSDPILPRPTDSELAILRLLWRLGPSTVREVFNAVNESRAEPLGYTTVLRFLQIMKEKGLVIRTEEARGHVFAPAVPAERTKRQIVGDVMERVFGGSAKELVVQALGTGKISVEEVREIRKMLNELDSEK